MHYCDEKCQLYDWLAFHKHGECDFYRLIAEQYPAQPINDIKGYMGLTLRLFHQQVDFR